MSEQFSGEQRREWHVEELDRIRTRRHAKWDKTWHVCAAGGCEEPAWLLGRCRHHIPWTEEGEDR